MYIHIQYIYGIKKHTEEMSICIQGSKHSAECSLDLFGLIMYNIQLVVLHSIWEHIPPIYFILIVDRIRLSRLSI